MIYETSPTSKNTSRGKTIFFDFFNQILIMITTYIGKIPSKRLLISGWHRNENHARKYGLLNPFNAKIRKKMSLFVKIVKSKAQKFFRFSQEIFI